MKMLVAFVFVLAGIAQSNPITKNCKNCFTGPTGPTLKPIEQCNQADQCAVFGGFRVGNFRISSDATTFVTCTGSEVHHCQRCPRNNNPTDPDDEYLYFSEKCDACLRRDELDNPCFTTPAPKDVTTPARPNYEIDFCSQPPQNGEVMGNVADPVNEYYYYACALHATWHMPCGGGLVFNSTCNACIRPSEHTLK